MCIRDREIWHRNGDEKKYGETVGQRLRLSAPEEVYAITPVTIKKYGYEGITQIVTKTIRKSTGRDTYLIEKINDSGTNSCAYKIGTVMSIKGTEKSRVVVYGLAKSYCPIVNNKLLAKRIYVAISRAKDHLHLMLRKKLPEDSPLKAFENSPLATVQYKHIPWKPSLSVTDLAGEQYRYWPKELTSGTYTGPDQNKVPRQGVSVDANEDHDFVGLYIEAVLAYCLGFEINDSEVQIILSQAAKVEGDIVCGEDGRAKRGLPIVKLNKQFQEGQKRNPCYALARARRSLKDGKMYEKSGHLEYGWEKHKEECHLFADFILRHLSSPRSYQKHLDLVINPHRSSEEVGTLVGIADFAGRDSVVEVKHVSEIQQKHRVQTALYAAMYSYCQEALLVNLKDSKIETVTAVPRQELLNLARAKLAIRNACARKKGPRRYPTRHDYNDCYIAVSRIKSETNQVGEIGAVAFSLDGNIFGTYHRVLPGVEEVSEANNPPSDPSCCKRFRQAKLRVVSTEILQRQQGSVQEEFQKWVKCMPSGPNLVPVFWIYDDAADLKLREMGCAVHLQTALPDWLSASSSSSEASDVTLRVCVERVFGYDWPYEPHRAFEDAVAIAALHVALSETREAETE